MWALVDGLRCPGAEHRRLDRLGRAGVRVETGSLICGGEFSPRVGWCGVVWCGRTLAYRLGLGWVGVEGWDVSCLEACLAWCIVCLVGCVGMVTVDVDVGVCCW